MDWIEEFRSDVPPIDRRKLGGTINAVLMDALLRHRHYLLRVENGIVRDVVGPYREAMRELRAAIARIAGRADALTNAGLLTSSEFRAIQLATAQIIGEAELSAVSTFGRQLGEFARAEGRIQANLLARNIPEALGFTTAELSSGEISAIVEGRYLGDTWRNRMGRQAQRQVEEVVARLRSARALERPITGLTRGIETMFSGGVIGAATMTVRTESGRVANDLLMDTMRKNAETVKKGVIVETLDDLTCLICLNKDGTEVEIRQSRPTDLPPFHPNCRGFVSPVLASSEELGLMADDLSDDTRMALDGRVPASVTYKDWFRTQDAAFQRDVLGPTRFRLWKRGDLELHQMVRDQRIIPIAELPVRVP